MARSRFSRRTLREAIEYCDGSITRIAHTLGCSRQTVYLALERFPDLKPVLEKNRTDFNLHLVDIAKSALELAILKNDLRAIMFALRQYDKEQVPGGLQLSDDVLMLLADMHIDQSQAVAQFEMIVRQQAELARADGTPESDY
jgi:hypothetical protein